MTFLYEAEGRDNYIELERGRAFAGVFAFRDKEHESRVGKSGRGG